MITPLNKRAYLLAGVNGMDKNEWQAKIEIIQKFNQYLPSIEDERTGIHIFF